MIRYLNFHTIGNRVIYELCIARSSRVLCIVLTTYFHPLFSKSFANREKSIFYRFRFSFNLSHLAKISRTKTELVLDFRALFRDWLPRRAMKIK